MFQGFLSTNKVQENPQNLEKFGGRGKIKISGYQQYNLVKRNKLQLFGQWSAEDKQSNQKSNRGTLKNVHLIFKLNKYAYKARGNI